VELTDGRKVRAEVYGVVNGRFFLLDRDAGKQVEIPETEIRSVDFGVHDDYARSELLLDPAQALTVEGVRRLAERRAFPQMLILLQSALNRQGRAFVEDLERRVAREIERPDLSASARLDLELARVAVLTALGEHGRAQQEFFRIRRDHREEPAVRQFGRTMEWLRERAAERPERPLERRKFAPTPRATEAPRHAPAD